MRGYFPCGVCQAYVPAGKGCRHYRPGRKRDSASLAATRKAEQRAKQAAAEAVARFRELMT